MAFYDEPQNIQLSNILENAAKGDPGAKDFLPALADSYKLGPQDSQDPVTLSSGKEITPFDTGMTQGYESELPEINAIPEQGISKLEAPAEEEGPKRDWGTALDKIAVGLADVGSALGSGQRPQGGGYEMSLSRLQADQQQQLSRRQRAWEDAYNSATSLDGELLQQEGMEELAQAHAAILKDLEDGKIDNEKTLSNFLTAKSKYSREIEQYGVDKQYRMQKETEDRAMQDDFARRAQMLTRFKEITANPEAFPPGEVEQAQQALSQLPELVETEYGTVPMTPPEKMKYMQWTAERATDQSRHEATLAQGNQRLSLMAAGQADDRAAQQSREQYYDRQGVEGSIANSLNKRYQAHASTGLPMTPQDRQRFKDEALEENASAIEKAVGLEVRQGGVGDPQIQFGDERPQPLDPNQWVAVVNGQEWQLDYDPTTQAGKLRLLRDIQGAVGR
jgi:hypothetical protein